VHGGPDVACGSRGGRRGAAGAGQRRGEHAQAGGAGAGRGGVRCGAAPAADFFFFQRQHRSDDGGMRAAG